MRWTIESFGKHPRPKARRHVYTGFYTLFTVFSILVIGFYANLNKHPRPQGPPEKKRFLDKKLAPARPRPNFYRGAIFFPGALGPIFFHVFLSSGRWELKYERPKYEGLPTL